MRLGIIDALVTERFGVGLALDPLPLTLPNDDRSIDYQVENSEKVGANPATGVLRSYSRRIGVFYDLVPPFGYDGWKATQPVDQLCPNCYRVDKTGLRNSYLESAFSSCSIDAVLLHIVGAATQQRDLQKHVNRTWNEHRPMTLLPQLTIFNVSSRSATRMRDYFTRHLSHH